MAPFRDQVITLCQRGVERRAIFDILREQHALAGNYGAVDPLRAAPRAADPGRVRLERDPGDEAQVDFGYAGQLRDPASDTLRKAWAFVMTLSFSRHSYVEFVFDQEVDTWLRCHRRAFEWFGGVPRRIVHDYVSGHIIVLLCLDGIQATGAERR